MSLCANVANGGDARLWITRRLANQLMMHMKSLINGASTLDQTVATKIDANTVAQSEALPDDPVRYNAGSPEYLVHAVDVVQQREQILLTFRGSSSLDIAVFGMPLGSLEQWVSGVGNCYVEAGWDLEGWLSLSPRLDSTSSKRVKKVH